jgi:hypothetical protein
MRRRSVVVSTLGITQTLAWGSTYYLAAVFADPVSATLTHGWRTSSRRMAAGISGHHPDDA